jgi:hypothetical protein
MPRAGPTDRSGRRRDTRSRCSETDFSERDRPGFALLCQSRAATFLEKTQASGGGNRSSRPYTKAERRDNGIHQALTHCGKPPQKLQPLGRQPPSCLSPRAFEAHIRGHRSSAKQHAEPP